MLCRYQVLTTSKVNIEVITFSRGSLPPSISRGHHNNDKDGPPPRLEARPALAAGVSGEVNTATDSSNHGGRGSLSVVDFPDDDPYNDLSAGGGLHSSDAGETWGATR